MNKFNKNEVVIISSNAEEFIKINSSKAVVRTFDQNQHGIWVYTVSVDADDGMLWCLDESELRFTGKFRNGENVMSGETVKVTVDPKTGEGKLADIDD